MVYATKTCEMVQGNLYQPWKLIPEIDIIKTEAWKG